MANRRFGGNQRGGGRSFQQANLNPWQGGVAPGNSLDNNIQAQLALALTNLLQPQQQSNPPSLLSLNTSPGFMNQDSYGPQQNRFASRGRSDFRRSEPYNKNRGGGNWRNDRRGGSFGRSNPRSFKDKKSESDKVKSSDTPKASDKVEKSSKIADESKSKTAEPEIIDISMDELRDEDGSEVTERKREWLKEKNNTEESENDTEEKKEGEVIAGDVKKEKKDNSRFAGLPAGFLHCFVCDKSMWDGESFQNHVRGKAHKQMLNSMEDSFQIIVNILRENMRLTEEKKMIELNRIQRNNRKYVHKFQEPESHCNMCDLKFLGKIISHRKTEGHQRLKRFLHPNCDTCVLEFPSRMEWVDHRFTPEHLIKLKEVMDAKGSDEDGYAVLEDNSEFDIEPLLQENMLTEDDNPVMELTDDLANLQNRIPAYSKSRAICKNSLKPAEGFMCEICNSFFKSENMAQSHLKSEGHYYQFITVAKNKYKRTANEKMEGDEEGNWKRKKLNDSEVEGEKDTSATTDAANGGDEIYDPEEACNEEETADDKEVVADEEKMEEIKEGEEGDVEGDNTTENKEEENKEVATENEAEEELLEEKEAEEPEEAKEEPQTPSKGTRKRVGAVRNGAGPKSKTRAAARK